MRGGLTASHPGVGVLAAGKAGVVCALLALATGGHAEWHARTGSAMGTRIDAELWHPDAVAAADLLDAVMAEMQRVDRAFSPFRDDSELSLVNREAGRGWRAVSGELFGLLEESRQVSELTEGALDITFASVGRYYDYRNHTAPDDATLRAALEAIDYRYVELDTARHAVRFRHEAVYIDLGGIAKGHAVDRAIGILLEAGITNASVSAGGKCPHRGRPARPAVVGGRA